MKRRPKQAGNVIEEYVHGESTKGGEKTRMIRIKMEDVHGSVLPRRQVCGAGIAHLAASIARHGLLSPVVVRKSGTTGKYMLVCGARRLEACRMIGMKQIDAVLVGWEGAEAAACCLEEEMSREPLSAMELSELLKRHAAAARACAFGGERARRLAALGNLAQPVRELARREALTLEQAEPLLLIQDAGWQMEAAQIIAQRNLTPAQAKRLVCFPKKEQTGKRRAMRCALEEIHALAARMRAMGMNALVSMHSQDGGVSIQILLKM